MVCKGRNNLVIIQIYLVFCSIYANFAAEMQITDRQMNIALALVAAGLLAVCIITGGRFFCYIQSFCHENLEGSVFLCTFAAVNS